MTHHPATGCPRTRIKTYRAECGFRAESGGLTYASVCDGIGAAHVAWHPLGWRCAWVSEVEPFCNAVVDHHWGFENVGDMLAVTEDRLNEQGRIDLLVGGTPCQSFSVAGLRAGLDDPRGNLTIAFVSLLTRLNPEYFVWENVPGFLSIDDGDAARRFLDAVEDAGYVIDIDILDAQYFDLAQRRRRIFVCGQKASSILRKRTISSALTISQCLVEILHLGLIALCDQSTLDSENLGFDASEPTNSLRRRMRLFGLHRAEAASMLQKNLDVLQRWSEHEQSGSDCPHGTNGMAGAKSTVVTGLLESTEAQVEMGRGGFQSIGTSWSSILGDLWNLASKSTTSTAERATTESRIYGLAQACLLITKHITPSMRSSPTFWNAASSSLTTLKGFIDYARSTSECLFAELGWVQPWRDFLREAERTADTLGNLRVGNFGEVLPISESMSGHPAPRRKAGPGVAALTARGVGTCGADDNQAQAGHLVSVTLTRQGAGSCDPEMEPIIPILEAGKRCGTCNSARDGIGVGEPDDPMFTLQSGAQHAVAFAQNTRDETRLVGGDGQLAGSLSAQPGMKQQTYLAFPIDSMNALARPDGHTLGLGDADDPQFTLSREHCHAVATPMAVRRLTPRECERLQAFPDNYTAITYRNKPAADGPRYRALGNSMAVNVMRWIGRRISLVSSESTTC